MTQQQEELDRIKAQIQQHLISSGNYDIINKQLKLQLYESGWYDQLNQLSTRELQETGGNFEQLLGFIKPKAEEMVPSGVKEDIVERIKDYLEGIIDT